MNTALHAATVEVLAGPAADSDFAFNQMLNKFLGTMSWAIYAMAAAGIIGGTLMVAVGSLGGHHRCREMGLSMTIGSVVIASATAAARAVTGGDAAETSDTPTPAPTPGVPSEPFNWAPVLIGLCVLIGVIAAAVLVVIAVGKQRQHAEAAQARRRKLAEATKIRDDVRAQWDSFLLDPADTLWKRPLLDDLHEPKTIAFLDAWRATTEAFLDLRPRQDVSVAAALAAATEARTAWEIASRHAERIGLGDLSTADRAKLETARKMLDRALDPAVGNAERESCVARIAVTLASITPRTEAEVTAVVRAKVTKVLALDTTHRRAIESRG
ncbi:hypothetical protein [Tsukamurella spumae]|uniref:Uncharacterized protein n=1 Tax=Tsukamurella spumae TaxID=44753 RepID=A0A846X4G8_9ACTN|nr:hypothetical protein [Tsukamurella spumae]NKY19455.1 hypothetical protein [Tsukamurella spumae]